jgi:excisionase family DNA binding protein
VKSYTVADAADILGIREKHVIKLIHAGQLEAFNVTADPAGLRPTWRVPSDAIEAFKATRMHTPPQPRAQRRRQPAEVVEFIK